MKISQTESIKSEALATMNVVKHTTIPIPTVLDVVSHSKGACMSMTTLPDVPASVALHTGELPQDTFEEAMKDWLTQLRSLPTPPQDAIASFDGDKLRCNRLTDSRLGLFRDITAFHRFVGSGPEHLHNIVTRGGKITGLMDWECAGWWPEYRDYTIAMYFHRRSPKWASSFTNIFPQYSD